MEARKTKNALLKQVVFYMFMIALIAGCIYAYMHTPEIDDFFAQDLTEIALVNAVIHAVPQIIQCIQIIMVAFVINLFVKLLSKITFGMTDKVKTLINLIASLIKWIIVIVAFLFILSVWGVDTATLLAGAGIVALVIGLGAQSLIADILAGIFIVLEGEYVVGDIVVIDGWRGKIVSIGIRTTELQDIGGNIKIINNSEIKSVINKTKLQSVANCSINVTSEVPLVMVEDIIKNALPEIRQSIPAITDDIVYKGINTVSDITTEMLFTARCYEEDLYQVQRDLHRELKLLLDKNGIAPFAPPTYIIDGKGSQRPVPVSQIAHTQQHTMPQPAPQQHAPTAVQAEVKPQQEVQAKPVPTAEKDQPAPQDAQRPVVKPPENPEQARPIVKPPENAGQVRPVVKPPENAGQARPVVRPPENAGQAPQAPRPVVRPPQAGAPAPQGAPRPVLRGQPQTRNGQPGNGARPQQ